MGINRSEIENVEIYLDKKVSWICLFSNYSD